MIWIEGRRYSYYGAELLCVRRYFDGALEMVDLAFVTEAPAQPEVFTRTARTLAPSVLPRVTATLGGVCHPDRCPHFSEYGQIVSDAGPHAGRLCCGGCGAALDAPPTSRIDIRTNCGHGGSETRRLVRPESRVIGPRSESSR